MTDDRKLKEKYECRIREAIRDGFTPKCGIRYAANEICAEHFLETGKDIRKIVRKAQDVLCGADIYEHPRKTKGWFSFSGGWRDLFWENKSADSFLKSVGLDEASGHSGILMKISSETDDPVERAAKIYFYCLLNMPFDYANAVAGRFLAAKYMLDDSLGIFGGVSQGLSKFRDSLVKIGDEIRNGAADSVFSKLLELWRKSRMINLRNAFEIVDIWNSARTAAPGVDPGALEFYMGALDDDNVRDVNGWARMSFTSPELAKKYIDELLSFNLALERKRGYEILARTRIGGLY